MDTWCFYGIAMVTVCLNEGDLWRISVLGTGNAEGFAIITHDFLIFKQVQTWDFSAGTVFIGSSISHQTRERFRFQVRLSVPFEMKPWSTHLL